MYHQYWAFWTFDIPYTIPRFLCRRTTAPASRTKNGRTAEESQTILILETHVVVHIKFTFSIDLLSSKKMYWLSILIARIYCCCYSNVLRETQSTLYCTSIFIISRFSYNIIIKNYFDMLQSWQNTKTVLSVREIFHQARNDCQWDISLDSVRLSLTDFTFCLFIQ